MCFRIICKSTEPSSFLPFRKKEGVELTPNFCPSNLDDKIKFHLFLLASFSSVQTLIFSNEIPCCFKIW